MATSQRDLPPLGGLRAFETAARLGSFRAAAGELGVTPAAVSQQVKGLEGRLGLRLFDRGPHSLTLTSAGQQYLPALRDAFDAIAMATAGLAAAPARAMVELAVPAVFTAGWLLPRLERFHAAHPGVELRLRNSHRLLAPGTEDVDAAIRHGRAGWDDLESTYLFGDALVAVCSPEAVEAREGGARRRSGMSLDGTVLLETGAERAPNASVVGAPRQALGGSVGASRQALGDAELARDGETPWDEWRAVTGIPGQPRQRLVLGDEGLIVQAALNGLGIALVDQHVVEGPLRQGRLVLPFDIAPWRRGTAWYLVRGSAGAVRQAAATSSPGRDEAFRAMRDWLLLEAGGVTI
jgi:LysR family glycine cleavage system transcriptional activator